MYIKTLKDMYEDIIIRVTLGGLTETFSIIIGLYQGSTISLNLFITVLDELTGSI